MLTRVIHGGDDCMRLTLDEYVLHSPPIPTDRRAYLNGGVKNVRDQKFEHTPLPDKRTYLAWPRERQQELENQEWDRRKNGVWFFNCGEPTYLTGNHYYYLNYHRYKKNAKPEYRQANLEFFWVWQFCYESDNCYGLYLHTRRRDGKTSRSASIGLEAATRVPSFRFGIASKTDVSARDSVYVNEVIRPLKALRNCPWFMPELVGKIDPANWVEFGSRSTTARDAQQQVSSEDDLSSSIGWFLPTANAADSDDLDFFLNDEVAKKQFHDAYQRWMTVRPQFIPSGIIKGKAICATTTDRAKESEDGAIEESDKAADGTAVKQGRKFWNNSDHTELEPGETTESGLWRLFVPAYKGFLVDAYGRDTPAGRAHFEKLREGLTGAALINQKRENPFTIDEALLEPVREDSLFHVGHITDNLNAIEEHEARTGRPLVRRYRLCWEDEAARRPPVRAVPDPSGPWQFSWLPPAGELNQMLRIGFVNDKAGNRWAKWLPMREDDTSMGNDPVMRKKSSLVNKNRASNYSLLVFRPYNEWVERERSQPDYWPSEAFIGRYNARPENAKTCYEEAMKACHLFGTKLYCETQTNAAQQEDFEEHGYEECLAAKALITQTDKETQSAPGEAASEPANKRRDGMVSQYIMDYVGSDKTENSRGEVGKNDFGVPYDYRRMPFAEVLRDNKDFDENDRRKYDDTVAQGFALSHAKRRGRVVGGGGRGDGEQGVDPSQFDPSNFFRR